MRAIALAAVLTLLLNTPTFGQQMPTAGAWQAGPGAAGANTYAGVIDAPTSGSTVTGTGVFTLSGWFVDTTAQGWAGADDVQVFLGTMENGKSQGHGDVALNRPDVASALGNPYWGAAGWQTTVDSGAVPSGQDTFTVYVHTPVKGWWYLQVTVLVGQTVSSTGELLAAAPAIQGAPPRVTVSAPAPSQLLSTRVRTFLITGTAIDATNGARGIDWVEVWLNGEANSDAGVILGVADLNSDGSWSLPFDPGAHEPINSNLYVYAHSQVSGKKSLLVRNFFITDRPPP
jgi:hypothetical protein